MKRRRLFLRDEEGAVTVDWVVLTAILVGLAMSTIAVFSGNTYNIGVNIETQLTELDTDPDF